MKISQLESETEELQSHKKDYEAKIAKEQSSEDLRARGRLIDETEGTLSD
jgi:hypothetical protein